MDLTKSETTPDPIPADYKRKPYLLVNLPTLSPDFKNRPSVGFFTLIPIKKLKEKILQD